MISLTDKIHALVLVYGREFPEGQITSTYRLPSCDLPVLMTVLLHGSRPSFLAFVPRLRPRPPDEEGGSC